MAGPSFGSRLVGKHDLEPLAFEDAILADHLESVKSLAELYRKAGDAAVAKGDLPMAKRHEENSDNLEAAADEIIKLRRATMPIPASYGDLSDLPPELLSELAGVKIDELEQQIHSIVKAGGAEVDLDKILIELFRRYQVLQTRRFVQNKIWRMVQKGLVHSVAGKKGVYSGLPPEIVSSEPAKKPSFGSGSFSDDLDDDSPF